MKKIITLIALHFALLTFAQPGSVDTSFNSIDTGFGEVANGIIRTTLLQPDGKIIITGDFTKYGGSEAIGMARLDSSGRLDRDFSYSVCSTACHFIYTTSLQSDGKIIIGGAFTGTSRNRIARLNSNGDVDTSFNLGTGFNNMVFYTAIQSDGKIIVAGDFTSYNGTAINKLARLNVDGTLDSNFNPGASANNSIKTISIQSNGKIIVAGDFTSFNGVTCSRIACLNSDGSVDALFNTNPGANDTITSTSIQSDGKIIIGGSFTSYAGTARNRIARLNPDGSLDISFSPGFGANNNVSGILNQADGKIIISGTFTSYGDVTRNGIARLNTNGSLDTTFSAGTVATDIVCMASLQADGKIVVAGTFKDGKSHITRLNTTGTTDNNFNQAGKGANGAVYTSAVLSSGKIIIAGDFTVYNDVARNRIARLNADGTLDASFNPGTGADDSIGAIAVQKDGKIIIGGRFEKYNGVKRYCLARLNADGSLDTTFNSRAAGLGPSGPVNTISIQSDGKIIIGGEFSTVGLTIINNIARLDTLGNLDTSFNPGINPDMLVGVSLIQPNGKIVIGGYFFYPSEIIVRLNGDGSLDKSFYNMSFADMIKNEMGKESYVASLSLQSDGKIIVGGKFYDVKTGTWDGLYRLNPDGSFDSSFNTGTSMKGYVNTVALQSDGKINVGGSFTNMSGNRIARLNANGSLAGFNSGSGPDNEVYTMSLQSDGKIIIGGIFKSYDGVGRNRIARIIGGTSSLGLNDNEFAKSITLYPNPVSDILTIESSEDIAEVTIYDSLGKSVKTLTSFDKRIDVSSLPSGIYIINITDEKSCVYRSKFVKK